MAGIRVRLLGPVDITVAGTVRPVPGLRRKTVLAVLGLHAGRTVSSDWLIDVVWGGTPPTTAANTLQRHISYLRSVLGTRTAIVSRPPGYLLVIPDEATDVAVADRLIRRSEQTIDPAVRAADLRTALSLWRGEPLSDVTTAAWLSEQAVRLADLRSTAVEALIDARIELGEHVEVVQELVLLTQRHPFREHLHGQLMLALYRAGRQAEALAAYRRLRRVIADELGVDPVPALRDLETAILRQDPALDLVAPAIALTPATTGWVAPAQLPLATPAFSGRERELAHLDAILAGKDSDAESSTASVATVVGTAGVGKTALAMHWAHRVADQFPDGHLYVNLRGFDPGGVPVDPCAVVGAFLDALGVPAARIPAGLSEQAALYRSMLAGRRVLVVLDNARDVAQVRPLLPGSAAAMVIVTSRDELTALIAIEGAHTVALDLLEPADARDLLATRLGTERVAEAPDAVREVIAGCGGLPLALVVAAARAATRPRFPLAVLAHELSAANHALDPFHGDDNTTDVRAVFSWSYQALSPAAARLFRLIGLHPGPEASAAAAASLAGASPEEVRAPLAELTRAHLLTEQAPDRYTLHDLLRAYATEQTNTHDSAGTRDEALHRLLDHYLRSGYAAARLLEPCLDPITTIPSQRSVIHHEPTTIREALSWFAAEHTAILAAIRRSADAGFGVHTWQLAWTMTTFCIRRGYWHELESAQHGALAAAQRLNDPAGQAHALRGLGQAYARSGRLEDASAPLLRAMELFGSLGDDVNRASVHLRLGWLADRHGRPTEALSHAQQALDLFEAADYHAARGWVLNHISLCQVRLGNYREAIASCEQAMATTENLGDTVTEAAAWQGLGDAHSGLADHGRATACYQRAIDAFRHLGDRSFEAETLACLADSCQAAGDLDAAQAAWQSALNILDELNHPDADQVRTKLRPPWGPAAPGDETLPIRLTPREREVLALVCLGLTNHAIARRLDVSAHTVRTNLENAYARLGVHSRTAAATAHVELSNS